MFHEIKVKQIEHITAQSAVVEFDIPQTLQTEFNFFAGQYLTLEALLEGEAVRRSYSLCSAPYENRWKVGIKKIPGGRFSSYAKEQLKEGDTLKVSAPEGRFLLSETKKTFAAFAAGSGITPIYAMIKEALQHKDTHFTLVYGNKTPEETLFYHELRALEKATPDQLKIHWVYSQANVKDALFGRIDTAVVNYYWLNKTQEAEQLFLCGPEGMIDQVKTVLNEKGVKEEQILFERFTAVQTSTEPVNGLEKGTVEVKIIVDEEEHILQGTNEKTLLDLALQHKIEVPYSCQGGVCCSCIGRIKEGSATMENNQILTDDEVEEGLVLTCQAKAESAKVVVDFDDV